MRLVDADELIERAYRERLDSRELIAKMIESAQTIDAVPVVRCKDCKHNPKETWFECPMSHLSKEQRPETAWYWKGERKER